MARGRAKSKRAEPAEEPQDENRPPESEVAAPDDEELPQPLVKEARITEFLEPKPVHVTYSRYRTRKGDGFTFLDRESDRESVVSGVSRASGNSSRASESAPREPRAQGAKPKRAKRPKKAAVPRELERQRAYFEGVDKLELAFVDEDEPPPALPPPREVAEQAQSLLREAREELAEGRGRGAGRASPAGAGAGGGAGAGEHGGAAGDRGRLRGTPPGIGEQYRAYQSVRPAPPRPAPPRPAPPRPAPPRPWG
eukprot:tig00000478_g1265.t1